MASCRGSGGAAMSEWLKIALRKDVVVRAVKLAVIVGTILAAINHGDKLLALALSSTDALKIGVTFFVPYCVSTISSTGAIRAQRK
jgi:hypothetical protein